MFIAEDNVVRLHSLSSFGSHGWRISGSKKLPAAADQRQLSARQTWSDFLLKNVLSNYSKKLTFYIITMSVITVSTWMTLTWRWYVDLFPNIKLSNTQRYQRLLLDWVSNLSTEWKVSSIKRFLQFVHLLLDQIFHDSWSTVGLLFHTDMMRSLARFVERIKTCLYSPK